MKTLVLSLVLLLICSPTVASAQALDDWKTYAERTEFRATPRYGETLEYCKRLDSASPWVALQSFGTTPQGRDLPLLVLSSDGAFTPDEARATGKAVVLIQSGIHPGEPDGKDASLMLAREIAITKSHSALLDHVIVLMVPIFNVDGHERFGPYNRINQNGPEEMGWRVTSQNLNLNRDYLKADTPEMRAMLRLFTDWLPDLAVDCHVTNGMDFQYDVTYAMEVYRNIDDDVAAWIKGRFLPPMIEAVNRSGHLIAPYIWPREYNDISKGFTSSAATPRFSTGYGATQNRPSLLIETHMLKPYGTRVAATYQVLLATLETVNSEADRLRRVVRNADERVIESARSELPVYLPLNFQPTRTSRDWTFLGVKSRKIQSEVLGTPLVVFDPEPEQRTVPYYAGSDVVDSVRVPRYYVVPREYTSVIDVLRAHGIALKTLTRALDLEAHLSRLVEPRWQAEPSEGRHTVRFKSTEMSERRSFPAGSVVVPLDQRTGKIAVHLLEPKGPDSFVRWGFFDAIFEQKEYAEAYVLEPLAREMMERDTTLRQEFLEKVRTDSVFARNPRARMNFFYQRSPYWDASLGLYPVARIHTAIDPANLE